MSGMTLTACCCGTGKLNCPCHPTFNGGTNTTYTAYWVGASLTVSGAGGNCPCMGPYSSAVPGGPAVTHFAMPAGQTSVSAHSPQTCNWINPTVPPPTGDCYIFSNYNAPPVTADAYRIALSGLGVYTCTYSYSFPFAIASTNFYIYPPNGIQNYWLAICRLTMAGAGFEAQFVNNSTQCVVPPAGGWTLQTAFDLAPQGCLNGVITGYSWNAGTFTLSQP